MSHKFTQLSQKVKVWLVNCPSYRTKIWQFSKPCTGHCPSGIIIVELPLATWKSAIMHFNETSSIFSIHIDCLLHSQVTFGNKNIRLFFNGLNGVTILNHSGTAPGRKGQCCNALGFCMIFYAVSAVNCFFFI